GEKEQEAIPRRLVRQGLTEEDDLAAVEALGLVAEECGERVRWRAVFRGQPRQRLHVRLDGPVGTPEDLAAELEPGTHGLALRFACRAAACDATMLPDGSSAPVEADTCSRCQRSPPPPTDGCPTG